MSEKATTLYKSLTEEQKSFINAKNLKGSHPVGVWLDFFKPIVLMDTLCDKQRKAKKNWLIFFVIITFISFFFLALGPLGILIELALIFTIIVLSVKLIKLKNIDISNQLRLFVFPFLSLMNNDINKKENIELNLEFSNPMDSRFMIKEIPNTNRRYPKVKTKFYKNNWMSAKMKLKDETELDFNINDIIRRRDITKRSRSGKIKSKVKYKVNHVTELKVLFPKEKYLMTEAANRLTAYKENKKYHILKIKGKNISTDLDQTITPKELLNLVAQAFKCVKPI